MSSSNPNQRRLPPHIYRRRQIGCLFVVAILVAIIWGIVSLVNGANAGNAAKAGASMSAASTAGAGDACAPGAIKVTPIITDETSKETRHSFGPNETPYFGFSLTNNGTVDCSFNVGSAQQYFTVTSGAETYWRSADCPRLGTVDMMKVIKVGETLDSQATSWDKVRSSATGCSAASGQPPVPAGGVTYHLNVSVAGVLSDSADDAFILR